MAKSGDILEHPVTREIIIVRKTSRDTGGKLYQADFTLEPGGFLAAEHIHPLQEERLEILSGTVRGRIGGKEWTAGAGETTVVPPGTPHDWWNAGDDDLRVRVDFRPALRTETFFETFFGLAQDGKVSPKTGLPNLLRTAVVLQAYRDELVLTRPPRFVQIVLLGLLAPIGRLLGYKADYPYPYGRKGQAEVQTT
jgi:quercetin dioxygenase-like cupin family protein